MLSERLAGSGREVSRNTLVTIDSANIPANTTLETLVLTSDENGIGLGPTLLALGLTASDQIIGIEPVAAPEAGLVVNARVSAAGTIAINLANVTVAAIDPVVTQYKVCWRRTS